MTEIAERGATPASVARAGTPTSVAKAAERAGRERRMPAERRRRLVLDVAMAEFAVHGFAGTSTEDVARRAGISQPYLFRLFPTKKALFVALIERCFRRVWDAFAAAAEGLTGEDAKVAMADEYERLLEDRTLLLLQMQAYAACEDLEIREATRNGFRRLWELSERATGLPYQEIVDFFAVGMLMNVAAAMNLPEVDERWTRWCPKEPKELTSGADASAPSAPSDAKIRTTYLMTASHRPRS